MSRFCVTLPDELHETLRQGAKKKNRSISNYMRELIEMGLEIESISEEKNNDSGQFNSLFTDEKLALLWKNILSWSLETRVLTRVLFEKILDQKLPNAATEMQMIKDKSQARAEGLIGLDID